MKKRSEIPAIVAKSMGINLLEVQITDTLSPRGEVVDGFLTEIDEFPISSIERYNALAALTHNGKFMALEQAEKLCRLFPLRPPEEIIIPSAVHAAAGIWLHRAQHDFAPLLAFLDWAHMHAEHDPRFATLRMDAAKRLANAERTNEQLKKLYTQTFVEPTFSELRDQVLRSWETTSLIAAEQRISVGALLQLMPTFAQTPAVRAKCIELYVAAMVRQYEAYV